MAVPIARSCMDSQVLSHALLGALLAEVNGANAAGGALAGAGGELAAQVLTQALYEGANPDDLGEGQRQIISSLSSLVGALAGGIVGGDRGTVFNAAVGGNVATNAVENNRLLSLQELDVIARLTAEGYSEEELRAVACAMVRCLLGRGLMEPGTMAEGLGGHFYLTEAGEQLANEYQAVLGSMSAEEISAISSRLAGTGMFGYSRTDAWRDAVRDTGFMTRLDGLGQATTGTLGSLGISAFCTLTGGIGCAAGGTAAAAEASDNITAGLAAFYTGRPTLTLQNQVWQGLGLSPEQANLAEGFTGLVIAGGGAHATNRALSGNATTLDTVTVNGTKPDGTDTGRANGSGGSPVASAVVDSEAAGFSYYDRFKKPDGTWDWPTNLGFAGDPVPNVLPPGTRLDRYGGPDGAFLSPQGTPYEQRALAPGSRAGGYYRYEVIKPLPVIQGEIAPAFDQPGGGIQVLPNLPSRVNVQWLIDYGYIRPVD